SVALEAELATVISWIFEPSRGDEDRLPWPLRDPLAIHVERRRRGGPRGIRRSCGWWRRRWRWLERSQGVRRIVDRAIKPFQAGSRYRNVIRSLRGALNQR